MAVMVIGRHTDLTALLGSLCSTLDHAPLRAIDSTVFVSQ